MTLERRVVSTAGAAPAVGYAHAVELVGAGRLVFVSCQVPVAPDGTVPEGIEAQTVQVWANVLSHLASAGMSVDNIVKVTVFLSDRRFRPAVNSISDEVLGGRLAAWTTIVAGIVHEGWLLEIEAIAAE